MRIAVTGAGGGLGRAFLPEVPSRHDVHAFTHDDLPVEDRHAVMQRLLPVQPAVVLHLASMTSVDGCERDPDRAYLVNALGTRNVAFAAREAGALLVTISTDYVFDGSKDEPYHEFDRPSPISVYGASKLAGEVEAAAHAPDHLIVRTAWVYGAGDDFVTGAIRRLASGEEVGGIVDRVGSPTFVGHLADRLLPLVLSGLRGVVHLAGPEPTTFHDMLVRARALGDLPGSVVEQKAADLDLPAERLSAM